MPLATSSSMREQRDVRGLLPIRLAGTVDWASEEAKEDSRKGTDQLVGAQLLSNVRQREDGRWDGRLFIPDVNRRVHAKIQLLDEAHLKVSGCALGRSLCKSQVWVRCCRTH